MYFIFIFPQFNEKVSDYRAVGLSSRRTIDTHPNYSGDLKIIQSYRTDTLVLLSNIKKFKFSKERHGVPSKCIKDFVFVSLL